MDHYVHHVPGRLRVKIPMLKSQPRVEQEIREVLDLYGVIEVRIKTITGSVLIHYDPECLQFKQLMKALSGNGYFDDTGAVKIDDKMSKASSKARATAGKVLFGWGLGKALEANGLSLLAALI